MPVLSNIACLVVVGAAGIGCAADSLSNDTEVAAPNALGSACPGGATHVDAAKELILTDLSLVDSARATTWSGVRSDTAWADGSLHFGRLMADLEGNGVQQNGQTYQPFPSTSAFVHRWLDELERYDETNCDKVPARPAVNTFIRDVWPKIPGETDTYVTRVAEVGTGAITVTRPRLDMTRPPFRLLAVTFRGDLADLTPPGGPGHANDPERDPPQAGELRLIYGLIDPTTGAPKNFTVAFEYAIPAQNANDVTQWHKRWHDELAHDVGSTAWIDGVSRLVWEITRAKGARNTSNSLYPANPCLGCGQARPHDSNLHQIRTNDYKVLGATQEFREFRIPLSGGSAQNRGGAPVHFYLNQTMSERFMDTVTPSAKLGRYLDVFCEHVAAEHHKVPQDFPDKQGASCDAAQTANSVQAGRIENAMNASNWWLADTALFASCAGLSKNEIRHRFSRNTCNGCHGYEMGFRADTADNNFMIRPRASGVQSTLSPFISPGTYEVRDPVTGVARDFTELLRRKNAYNRVLCDGFRQPDYPTRFR